jgi:hypothetical protein
MTDDRNASDGSGNGDMRDVKLKKPRSPMLQMTLVALAVFVFTTLIRPIFSSDPADRGQSAADVQTADQVVDMTREMSRDTQIRTGWTEGGPHSLNDVSFDIALAPGWRAEPAKRQIFLRKDGDSRFCQITAQTPFDVKGFRDEVQGKEVPFENATVTEAMSMGVPPSAKVSITSTLLDSVSTEGQYRYVVRTATSVTMDTLSAKQTGVNATAVAGSSMVRLQCADTSGGSEPDGAMAAMGRSLALRSP